MTHRGPFQSLLFCDSVSMGRSRQMGKRPLLISNYFTAASSHQPNGGSGCMLVGMYSHAFSALQKVLPHTKAFTA